MVVVAGRRRAGAGTRLEPGLAPGRRGRLRARARRARRHVDVAAYAQTRAIALTDRAIGSPAVGRTRLSVAFGSTGGSFGAPRTIADGPRLDRPVLAVNARGDAAIAYFQDRGVDNDRVLVSVRRAGGSFGAPFQVGHGRIRSVAIAVGPRGDLLVAWNAAGVIRARYRAPSSTGFQPIETISSDPTDFAQMRAAVADGGRCYLAWSAQLLTEGGSRGPVYNEVAVRPSGHRFRAAQLLERDGSNRSQSPIAIATQGRDASVAWTGFDGVNSRVRVAATDPAAHLRRPAGRLARRPRRGGFRSRGRGRDPPGRLGQRRLRRQPGVRRARPAGRALRRRRGGVRRRRRRAPGARSSPPRRPSCGPTGRRARIRPAASPPCRPSPRRRRAPVDRVERRSSTAWTGGRGADGRPPGSAHRACPE